MNISCDLPLQTLTNVMLGVDNLSLCTRLSPPQFRFLVGLILAHNRIGFREPFTLTTEQAMAAGGGTSRQNVNNLRNALARKSIDGERLLTVHSGNFGKNTCATYKIGYNLLLSYARSNKGFRSQPSTKFDGTVDGTVDHPKKRKEKKTTGWMDPVDNVYNLKARNLPLYQQPIPEDFINKNWKEEKPDEYQVAMQRLTAYDINAREELLKFCDPEFLNGVIDIIENGNGRIKDFSAAIVSKARKEYLVWLKGREILGLS